MRKYLFICSALFFSTIASAQLYINEVCPGNADVIYDPDYFNFPGWIELYNSGNSNLNIGGYYLSDNTSNKTKWKIPNGTIISSKGYLLIWCDEENNKLHTNFTLDPEGEKIVLSTTGLAQVDILEYPKLLTNVSYGRSTDGGTEFGYLKTASPRDKNVATTGTTVLDNPDVSVKSGRYSGTQSVTLSHPISNTEIHYTRDGSEPTINSTKYSAPVSISATTTLKVKAFHNDYLPSKTEVKTYFINEHTFTLPVVSLSTKPTYLSDNTIGIYVDGTNGITGNCQNSPVNWNQDWDRHADLEYFDASGSKKWDQSFDIRIGGACSRGNPQKSFAVKARDKYGSGTLDERLFKSKDINSFGGFFLRNSGNDFWSTSFRDAFMQSLAVSQMDVDYMAYQPSVLYINGQYWGIQNLREKIDGDYIESNYGIKKYDIDLLETYENALEGTSNAWLSYKDSLQKINLTDSASFAFIDKHIDVQEYISYLVSEIYYCNTDWPGNNIKFWRQRSTNGKFRWIFWDFDFGFALYTNNSYATHPTLNFATDATQSDWPNPASSTLHIRLMLQNPVFRTRFIQTLTTAMSTTFKPERVNKFLDDFSNPLKTEIPFHKQRWGGNDWNSEVQRMRDFAIQRNDFMQQHTADFFGLTARVNLSVSCSPVNAGSFNLNGIVANEPLDNGSYFKDLPFTVEAKPDAGFKFKNWNITKRESTSFQFINKGDTWKYFDKGTSLSSNWNTTAFVDNTWSSGPAQLGYGEGDEQTVVDYGSDVSNKFITTYFRKTFTVDDVSGLEDISASVLFDDGVIVYLNGTEVYRNNMPLGVVDFKTTATQAIAVENVFNSFSIDKYLLTTGTNVLAVEVHQSSGGSSDISFDFQMKTSQVGNEVQLTSNSALLKDTAYSDVILEAVYEPISMVDGIIINEFSAAKSNVKDDFNETEDWIELYNKSSNTVDVAGLFITDDIKDKAKYRIPSGNSKTSMAPNTYLVLWADGQPFQGATHLNFKLSADGEDIGLYQVVEFDTLTLDELSFETQMNNVSSSRIPNGTGSFVLTQKLTPGTSNIFEEVVEVITGNDEGMLNSIVLYPNPGSDFIYVKTQSQIDQVVIHDLMGRQVGEFRNVLRDNLLSIENLESGLYIVSIMSGNDKKIVKFIKQ